MAKTYKYSDRQSKWYIRCPYCKHAWVSNNKDVTCPKCKACIKDELVKLLNKAARAVMKG